MTKNVSLRPSAERSVETSDALRNLSRAVYSPEETERWPGRHLQWADSQWDVIVTDDNGKVVSYTGVLVREATHDRHPVQIGGIGGVKTHPEARRRGYAALGLQLATAFFREQTAVDFALLVCDPALIAYYSRCGWKVFGGTLLTTQTGDKVEFVFNRVMVLDVHSTAPLDGEIDLQGPPW